jgi:uncharacterized protein YjdB
MKRLIIISLTLILALAFSCKKEDGPAYVKIAQLCISNDTPEMEVGDSMKLNLVFTPEDSTDKSVIWSSSDEAIASVDKEGEVNALSPGKTTILVSSSNGIKAIYEIIVLADDILVESIVWTVPAVSVSAGKTFITHVGSLPLDAINKDLVLKMDDEFIATFEKKMIDGEEAIVISGLNAGATILTASSSNGIVAACGISVVNKCISYEVESIELIPGDEVNISIDEEYYFDKIRILPVNAANKNLNWVVSDEDIVFIDGESGFIGNKVGTCTIHVESTDGTNIKSNLVRINVIK